MFYPKSKITENQYTSGGLLKDPNTGITYKGFYHTTYDGNYYAGASHSIDSKLLIPNTSQNNNSNNLVQPGFKTNLDYDSITESKMSFLFKLSTPTAIYPIPSAQDYKNGQFSRYFIQSINTMRIIEVSAEGFQSMKNNPMYVTLSLVWKLIGPLHDDVTNPNNIIYGVLDTNRRTVDQNERSMRGISKYLSNLIEFAKII